jgi:elongation factor Tu
MELVPDVEAIVTFLPTSQGGRKGPALSGYRPVHAVLPGYLTSGQQQYLDTDQVAPGESARAHIKFIAPEDYPHSLWPGKVINVQEGGRVVGHAEITQVFNEDLLRPTTE